MCGLYGRKSILPLGVLAPTKKSMNHDEKITQLQAECARLAAALTLEVVFDGPPDHFNSGFVEVETVDGKSTGEVTWRKRPDGYWGLRLNASSTALRDLLAPTIELLNNPLPCPNFGVQTKWGAAGANVHPPEITTTIPMEQFIAENIGKPCGYCPICLYNKRRESELTRLRAACGPKEEPR